MTKPPKAGKTSSNATTRVRGHGGSRLADAFDAVAALPSLTLARDAVLRAAGRANTPAAEIAEAAERDAALAMVLMRHANNGRGPNGRTASVIEAVRSLGPDGVVAAVEDLPAYGLFEPADSWARIPDRFRLHADAVAEAARRIAREVHMTDPHVLVTAALLHDCGELVLSRMYPSYAELRADRSRTPGERLRVERRELGIDHAVVGGVLLRRWALPTAIAAAVEKHHSDKATGLAAHVALADLVAHVQAGDSVEGEEMKRVAEAARLKDRQLARIMFEFERTPVERRPAEPSPLSAREADSLRGLVEGKVYKEIAAELGLSVSTVRSHLHNVYKKLGAADRAQAVLMARDRGWV